MNYPPWYTYMKNNKFTVGIMMYFGVNVITNMLTSTGAFEVIYDGTVIYSGMKTGKLPNVDEIVMILQTLAS